MNKEPTYKRWTDNFIRVYKNSIFWEQVKNDIIAIKKNTIVEVLKLHQTNETQKYLYESKKIIELLEQA